MIFKKIKHLWLVLIATSDCNLKCNYCYNNGGENIRYMDITVAKMGISAFLKEFPKLKKLTITFFGGEPTLNQNLIYKIVEFCQASPIKTNFRIVTNGMCEKKIWKFILENRFEISLSMDGIPGINNVTRGKSDGLKEKIKELVENDNEFQVRSTLTSQNIKFFSKSVRWWAGLGVKNIHFEEVDVVGRAKKNFINPPEIKIMAKEIEKVIKTAEDNNINLIYSSWMSLNNPSSYFCDSCRGFQYMLFSDGSIGGCFSAKQNKLFEKNFIVGKLKKNEIKWLGNKNYLQSISTEKMPQCKNCEVKMICGGGCYAQHLMTSGSILSPSPEYCERAKSMIALGKKYANFKSIKGGTK